MKARYLTMPTVELAALFDAASLEEAQAITTALVTERRTLAKRHPDAKFPGKPTIAIQLSLFTAAAGMGRVAERVTTVAREAGQEERVRQIREGHDVAIEELSDAA